MQTLLILAALATTHPNMTPIPQETKVAVICFSKGEQQSGMNKICYYDCLGSMTAITIGATQLCPLTINN